MNEVGKEHSCLAKPNLHHANSLIRRYNGSMQASTMVDVVAMDGGRRIERGLHLATRPMILMIGLSHPTLNFNWGRSRIRLPSDSEVG